MGKAKIIGVRPYDFVDRTSGRQMKGLTVYVAEQIEGTYGIEPNKIGLKDGKETPLEKVANGDYLKLVNRDCEVIYNKKGPEGILLIGQ